MMNMMKSKIRVARFSNRRGSSLSRVASIIVTVVGLIISLPFTVIVAILGYNFHSIALLEFLMLVGFFIGAPMFAFGLINFLIGGRYIRSSTSTAELDLGRIRYSIETNKNKG